MMIHTCPTAAEATTITCPQCEGAGRHEVDGSDYYEHWRASITECNMCEGLGECTVQDARDFWGDPEWGEEYIQY